jgi:hypothetical protein
VVDEAAAVVLSGLCKHIFACLALPALFFFAFFALFALLYQSIVPVDI